MTKEDLEKLAEELKNFPGNTRGESFLTRKKFIERKEGKEGVKKLEKKMKELGHPIVFDEIARGGWVNDGTNSLSIVVAKEIFGWEEEDVFELGRFNLKNSWITRTVLFYFVSIDKAFSVIPKYWERYYDIGELVGTYLDKDNKYAIMEKRGYKTHPLICHQHRGYLHAGVELVTGSDKVTVNEKSAYTEEVK